MLTIKKGVPLKKNILFLMLLTLFSQAIHTAKPEQKFYTTLGLDPTKTYSESEVRKAWLTKIKEETGSNPSYDTIRQELNSAKQNLTDYINRNKQKEDLSTFFAQKVLKDNSNIGTDLGNMIQKIDHKRSLAKDINQKNAWKYIYDNLTSQSKKNIDNQDTKTQMALKEIITKNFLASVEEFKSASSQTQKNRLSDNEWLKKYKPLMDRWMAEKKLTNEEALEANGTLKDSTWKEFKRAIGTTAHDSMSTKKVERNTIKKALADGIRQVNQDKNQREKFSNQESQSRQEREREQQAAWEDLKRDFESNQPKDKPKPKATDSETSATRTQIDAYKTLGLSYPPAPSNGDIRSAYKKLSTKWHPDKWNTTAQEDKNSAEREFKKIKDAYESLTKSAKSTPSFHIDWLKKNKERIIKQIESYWRQKNNNVYEVAQYPDAASFILDRSQIDELQTRKDLPGFNTQEAVRDLNNLAEAYKPQPKEAEPRPQPDPQPKDRQRVESEEFDSRQRQEADEQSEWDRIQKEFSDGNMKTNRKNILISFINQIIREHFALNDYTNMKDTPNLIDTLYQKFTKNELRQRFLNHSKDPYSETMTKDFIKKQIPFAAQKYEQAYNWIQRNIDKIKQYTKQHMNQANDDISKVVLKNAPFKWLNENEQLTTEEYSAALSYLNDTVLPQIKRAQANDQKARNQVDESAQQLRDKVQQNEQQSWQDIINQAKQAKQMAQQEVARAKNRAALEKSLELALSLTR